MSQQTKLPKQYQRGWTEFYKLKFYLTSDVLIPRPETELLVDEVTRIVNGSSLTVHREKQLTVNNYQLTIIDIGTGSGCIAISIAKNLPSCRIVATDISEQALEVARKNAKLHGIDFKQLIFIKNDLLEKFSVPPDIIVTNLPYIPTAKLMLVDPMVAEFEPKLALDGGRDGFELYRKMFSQMVEKNFYPKYLIAEVDEGLAEIAKVEVKKYFPSAQMEIKKDLAKLDRILIIKF